MKRKRSAHVVTSVALSMRYGLAAQAQQSETVGHDARIRELNRVGGPDAGNGIDVLQRVGALDDDGGAMAKGGAACDTGATRTQRVQFVTGATGASYDGTLTRGGSVKYVRGARNVQFLSVAIHYKDDRMSHQFWSPDGTSRPDLIAAIPPIAANSGNPATTWLN